MNGHKKKRNSVFNTHKSEKDRAKWKQFHCDTRDNSFCTPPKHPYLDGEAEQTK